MPLPDMDMRDAFFDSVYEIAARDRNVVFLTADHAAFSLERFKKDMPRQFFNVGIAEQNMVSVAAGLALSGKRVFIYSIANFVTLRCFEQLSVDLGGMKLPVVIVGVGAGFTYSTDGPTHHGTQDVAAMASIPNLAILNCSDVANSQAFGRMAYERDGPTYVRIEKGKFPTLYASANPDFTPGLAIVKEGRDAMIVTSGNLVHTALEAARGLQAEGMHVGVLDLYRIKPLNGPLLIDSLGKVPTVLTLEDNMMTGGIGGMVGAALCESGSTAAFKRLAIGDQHCFRYGDREWMYAAHGLDARSVEALTREFVAKR
jgi:transketolase